MSAAQKETPRAPRRRRLQPLSLEEARAQLQGLIPTFRMARAFIIRLEEIFDDFGIVVPDTGTLSDRNETTERVRPQAPAGAKVQRHSAPAPVQLLPPAPHTTPMPSGDNDGEQAHKLLIAAAWRNGLVSTAVDLALLAGYSPFSGGVSRALAYLRRRGFLDGCGITDDGLVELGSSLSQKPTPAELRDRWIAWLPSQQSGIFVECLRAHPRALTAKEAAEAANYSLASGGVSRAIAKLRRRGLVSKRGPLVVHPIFFDVLYGRST